jgi:hypothetical protein
MKGGKIGYYPPFDAKVIPGGALNLYDPFGISSKNSDERKAAGLVKEINNGRLACLASLVSSARPRFLDLSLLFLASSLYMKEISWLP